MSKLYPYYFEADKEIEDAVDVFIFLSGRATGKTTNILDYIALESQKNEEQFIYLDTVDSIANTKSRRDGIFAHNEHVKVFYDMQKFWLDEGKTVAAKNGSKATKFETDSKNKIMIGHYQLLANFSDYKSGDYDKVKWLVIDEASDKITNYGRNFSKDFMNLVSTDFRLRDAKLVFAGNVDNADQEFFRNIGITPEFIAKNYNRPAYFSRNGVRFKVLVFDKSYITEPPESQVSFAEKLGLALGHDINSIEMSFNVTDKNVVIESQPDTAIRIEGNGEVVYLANNHFYGSFNGQVTDTVTIDLLDGDLTSIKFRGSFAEGGQIYYTYQDLATKSTVKKILS